MSELSDKLMHLSKIGGRVPTPIRCTLYRYNERGGIKKLIFDPVYTIVITLMTIRHHDSLSFNVTRLDSFGLELRGDL